MQISKRLIGIFSLLLICCMPAWATGSADAGKNKATACAACHGADGNSTVGTWPKLAGQNPKYLFKQMQAFKKGKEGGRYDPSMTPQMANLSEQDMQDLAAYFASQKVTLGSTPKNYVKLGQALYRGGDLERKIAACSACHGPKGLGNNEAAFPALSGQQADYIIKQLTAYRSGLRASPNQIMTTIAQKMTDKDITAVAHYVAGLH